MRRKRKTKKPQQKQPLRLQFHERTLDAPTLIHSIKAMAILPG
jgi:hypothetical protein